MEPADSSKSSTSVPWCYRDVEGAVHVFPNGSITTLANRSKDFWYYVIDLPICFLQGGIPIA